METDIKNLIQSYKIELIEIEEELKKYYKVHDLLGHSQSLIERALILLFIKDLKLLNNSNGKEIFNEKSNCEKYELEIATDYKLTELPENP